MTENFEAHSTESFTAQSMSTGIPSDGFSKQVKDSDEHNQSDRLSLLSMMDKSNNKNSSNEHTTEQLNPSESSSSFDARVADSLSGRMAAQTFSQLSDFETGNGLNFSDVQRMHRFVATKGNPGPNDFIKTSSDLICTEKLTPGGAENGAIHLTEDQFRRFVKDQIEHLEPTADGPAVSDPIPVSLIVDGQRKEVEATLQITEDATGDVII